MNIEFVYITLLGITFFLDQRSTLKKNKIKVELKNQVSTIKFEKIVIK